MLEIWLVIIGIQGAAKDGSYASAVFLAFYAVRCEVLVHSLIFAKSSSHKASKVQKNSDVKAQIPFGKVT